MHELIGGNLIRSDQLQLDWDSQISNSSQKVLSKANLNGLTFLGRLVPMQILNTKSWRKDQ